MTKRRPMIAKLRALSGLLGMALVLTACGDAATRDIPALLRETYAAQSEGNAAGLENARSLITPEVIAAFSTSLSFVEVTGGKVYAASPVAQRAPADPGEWVSPALNLTVVLNGGLPVRTHGMRFDMAGADVGPTLAALASGTPQTLTREMRDLNGENKEIVRRFECDFAPEGRETISIFGIARETIRFREDCAYEDITFVNYYWRDTNGILWKSDSWLTPMAGRMTVERIKIVD